LWLCGSLVARLKIEDRRLSLLLYRTSTVGRVERR